ncbi:hypothetical protein ACFYVR_00295 [Rhodococcus sp. NPDC003318]|uniref:hypothetical protein n=1 Tax=Rhodococcus sp. NPDC003318 TaxID=3364503 RepID=UPI0036AD2A64
MKLHKAAVLSAALVAAMGVGAGNSYASPVPTQGNTEVGYQTSVRPDGRSVATVLDSGVFRPVSGGTAVDVVNDAGTALTRIPLAYAVGDTLVPITATIGGGGRELLLTPQAPPIGVQPAYSQAAYQDMIAEIEKGWLNGGQLNANTGAAIGLVVGCVLFLFVGCPLGAAIGGTIGAVTGVVNANPAVQPAVFAFLATLP